MEDKAGYSQVKALGDLLIFRADIVRYAFRRHEHDYYAVGIIEEGVQRFSCARRRCCLTPPEGISVINPGDAHTGESATRTGFRYRAIYPRVDHFSELAREFGANAGGAPDFADPVIADGPLFRELRRLLDAIDGGAPKLTQETLFLGVLAGLTTRHADRRPKAPPPGKESGPLARVKAYIDDNYARDIRLDDLAREAGLSRFYLIRAFRARTGMPPHAYLESVRVRRAQELLRQGRGIAEVAYGTGFSSQSHLTSTFKALLGVSPGKFAKAIS